MGSNQLKLNSDKTLLLTVGTAHRLSTLPEVFKVTMDIVDLEESKDKSELLLGCTIESNLKGNLQIRNLLAKLKTRLA